MSSQESVSNEETMSLAANKQVTPRNESRYKDRLQKMEKEMNEMEMNEKNDIGDSSENHFDTNLTSQTSNLTMHPSDAQLMHNNTDPNVITPLNSSSAPAPAPSHSTHSHSSYVPQPSNSMDPNIAESAVNENKAQIIPANEYQHQQKQQQHENDNVLLNTKLAPNASMDSPMDNDDDNNDNNDNNDNIQPPTVGDVGRMPSISMSQNNMETINEYRNPSRRSRHCSPTHFIQWLMHNTIVGKIIIMILTWTTVVDYAKDCYVAFHLANVGAIWQFVVTIAILFLSLRLMLYLRVTDDTVTVWKLFIFYLPGSVYADFQIDRVSDFGVCCFWEFVILIGTPFVPFYLIYLAGKKSWSLFCGDKNFENPHLLAFAVVECLFEAVPQLILQTFLYFERYITNDEEDIQPLVFYIAWIVTIIVLIKIPFIVWYNWRIVHKLEFKRRHNGEVLSVKYHPVLDIVASGSWDHTVLIHNFVQNVDILKAKRVMDHHYNINCIDFMPLNTTLEIYSKEVHPQCRGHANGTHKETWSSNHKPSNYGSIDNDGILPNKGKLSGIDSNNSATSSQKTSDIHDMNESNRQANKLQNARDGSATDDDSDTKNSPNLKAAPAPSITGEKERTILEFEGNDIIAVAGQGVEIWHWRSGEVIAQFPKALERDQLKRKKRKRTREVKAVKFTPDGKRVIWCQGKNIHIWQIIDKREIGKIKAIQSNVLGDVESIDVSPNGKYIAAGLHTGQIKIFNSYNCDCVRILEGHSGAVNSVKFDKDGRFVISGSGDWTVRLWYLKTGEEIGIFQKHTSDVMCVAVDATNRYVASGARDRVLYVTYLQDPLKPQFHRRTKRYTAAQAMANGGNLSELAKQPSGHSQVGTESISDASAVSQFSNFQPKMLNRKATSSIEQMRIIDDYHVYKAERDIRCCDFSPYGEFVAVGSDDHTVNLVPLPDYCNNSHNNASLSSTPHNKPSQNGKESKHFETTPNKQHVIQVAAPTHLNIEQHNQIDENHDDDDENVASASNYQVKVDIVDTEENDTRMP